MTIARPTAGLCAAHPGAPARWACQRCGTFVCSDCERRTRPEAPPLCPKCWELRAQTVGVQQATEANRLPLAGLITGLLSVLHPLLLVASLVLNLRALVRGHGGARRWMHVVGVAGSGVAVLVWVFALVFIWRP